VKKTNKKIILFLLFSFLLSACKDDVIVVPPPPQGEDFAPPRFNWRAMEINNIGFADIWAQDTNNIYLLSHYDKSLYIVSHGIVTTYYVGNYYLTQIKGLSNNEIYIFAAGYASNLLTIIKWNGGGFEYYPTDITVTTGVSALTIRGCAVSSNEVWALSIDGINRFNGFKMTDYSFGDPTDSLVVPIDLFLSDNHKIQYIANNADTGNNQNRLYEFRDTGFVKIYEDQIVTHMTLLREVGGVNFGLQLNYNVPLPGTVCIKYFTGSSFTDYFCYNNKISTKFTTGVSKNPVGTNLQSFIFLAQANELIFNTITPVIDQVEVGILHWDGNKVSKEIGVHGYENSYDFEHYILFAINQDNYLILEPFYPNNPMSNTLYIGTKKKNEKINY
jgi:hypothetical protein